MDSGQHLQAIINLKQQAVLARHRRLLVLSGDRSWVESLACKVLNKLGSESALWLTDQPITTGLSAHVDFTPAKKAIRHLGCERDFIVMDAYAGLHPDGFGAISGTLKAGGLFILLTPPLEQWSSYDDPDYERIISLPYQRENLSRRFISRMKNAITKAGHALIIRQGKPVLVNEFSEGLTEFAPDHCDINEECITQDQKEAVDAVCKVVTGHRRRPLVLSSDRGRGKSAALGIAAAKLIKNGAHRIILTAPYPEAVESAFSRLEVLFPQGKRNDLKFCCHQSGSDARSEVEFIAPDELIANSPDADLVMVDEAAAIPAPMLEALLKRYSRIVFASTIHGYEGTGRGFAVRFTKVLDQVTPDWKSLHIKAPIRWSENDPLEQFVFDTLLLNALPEDPCLSDDEGLEQLDVKWLNRESLSQNEPLLSQVFGLLVLAHYRTSPDDVRMLLDSPSIRIAALFHRSNDAGSGLVAVALVVREGGLDSSFGELVWQGRRRPRGHLIPQALSCFSGFKDATAMQGDRIMRIAVHPTLHQRGFGTYLINAIKDNAKKACLDYVGSSFGATPELLSFWNNNDFLPLRLGFHREAASGVHSVIMFFAISDEGVVLRDKAHKRFYEQFLFDLNDAFNDLDGNVVMPLLHAAYHERIVLNEQDNLDLHAFTEHQRIYESCSLAVWKLLVCSIQQGLLTRLSNEVEMTVLIRRVLQKKSTASVVSELKLKGKKELNSVIVTAARQLLRFHAALSSNA